MLHNAGGIEIMHKASGFEVFVDSKDVFDESTTLSPSVAILIKSIPKRDKNDLRFRPDLMNAVDEFNIVIVVDCAGYVIVCVIVVRSQVDDH